MLFVAHRSQYTRYSSLARRPYRENRVSRALRHSRCSRDFIHRLNSLRTSDFDYVLPAEQVAQHPAPVRSQSRLLRLGCDGTATHHRFSEIPSLLRPGDLLVRNDTRVLPARIAARRLPGGGRVEILLLPGVSRGSGRWFEALTRPALRPGVRLEAAGVRVEAGEPLGGGRRRLRILEGADSAAELAERAGSTPLPPYIRRKGPDAAVHEAADRERYQTVYASAPGSAAAPTAGLHFDAGVFRGLEDRGVEVRDLTLHIGHGTFAPVRTEDPREHELGAERFRLPEATRRAVRRAIEEGRRVVAVGTTAVRVLETPGVLEAGPPERETRLKILPGHDFRVVSALVTNFHLPRSSLLMLVAALAGREPVLAAYREAVRRGYRFHSYGDAMLVESRAGQGGGRNSLEPREREPSALRVRPPP